MTTPVRPWQLRWRAWVSRHVLLLAIVFLAPAFLLTRWLVGTYQAREHAFAAESYEQGEEDLRRGRVRQAVDDYRDALVYAPDNPGYRLRLAKALEQAGELEAAGADLRRLWEGDPANSVVNVELARLSARQHDVTSAVRYYNNAIYGIWPADAAVRRRDTQLELIDYLLANHRTADALAGLIALAADVPPDVNLRLAIGARMLEAGAEREAFNEFREAVTLAPRSGAALSAAGRVALRLGQFADAERYLRLAVRAGDASPATTEQLATVRAVLSFDPFARGLSSNERVRRVRAAVDAATASFGPCVLRLTASEGAALHEAAALHVRLAGVAPALRAPDARDAEFQAEAMDVVFDMEEFVASHCGPGSGDDQALLALGRSRRGPR